MASSAPWVRALSIASAARRTIDSVTSRTSSRNGAPAGRPRTRCPMPRPRASSRSTSTPPAQVREVRQVVRQRLAQHGPQLLDRALVLVPDLVEDRRPTLVVEVDRTPGREPRHDDLAGDGHRHLLVERVRQQVARLRDERQPPAPLPLRCLQPRPVDRERERVREALQQHALRLAEDVAPVRGDRQRADQASLGEDRDRDQGPERRATQQADRRARAVGHHDRHPRVPQVRQPGLVPRDPDTTQAVGEAADRRHLEGVVVRDHQQRRIGVERRPHPLDRERQVLVEAQPQQRVAPQPQRVGVTGRPAAPGRAPPGAPAAAAAPRGTSSTIAAAVGRPRLRGEDRHRGAVGGDHRVLALPDAPRRRVLLRWLSGRPRARRARRTDDRPHRRRSTRGAGSRRRSRRPPCRRRRGRPPRPPFGRLPVAAGLDQRARGGGILAVEHEPDSLRRPGVLDAPGRRHRGGHEQPTAALRGDVRGRHAGRQRAAGVLVLHLDAEAPGVESDRSTDAAVPAWTRAFVTGSSADRERCLVLQLRSSPSRELRAHETARQRNRGRIGLEAASSALRRTRSWQA